MFTPVFRIVLLVAFTSIAGAAVDLNREMILTPPGGSSPEDAEIVRWQKRADRDGASAVDYERLGWAFVAKARRTLDGTFYSLAAKTADAMDARFGASPSAMLLRGHAFHNLHRFREAESLARTLVAQRGMAGDFGLLSDALMEEGKLVESIDALQRMANLKPGAEVDTRIAHIRSLKGDIRGAADAMSRAIRETHPADHEALAWMLTRLAIYSLGEGSPERADEFAGAALRHLADYPPALLMRGRIALASGNAQKALTWVKKAADANPLPEYLWCLAETHRALGDVENAKVVEAHLAASAVTADPRTYSLFLATYRTDVAKAVALARSEFATRADIFTHDALAWAQFSAGNFKAADAEIHVARAEGTRDARLLFHAAVIARANGRFGEAADLAAQCALPALLPSERAMLANSVTAVAVR